MPADRHPRPTPVSARIATDLRERIAASEFLPGDLVPSERELVERWGVVRMTAAKALGRLKSEGLIATVAGVGHAVQDQRAAVGPAAQFERMHTTGRIRLPNERSDIQQTGRADAPPDIAAALGHTEMSGPALYRRRLVYRDDAPLYLATSWFAATPLSTQTRWPQVQEQLLGYAPIPGGTPMLIAELVGEDPCREDYTAVAGAASATEAQSLRVQAGAPVLRVTTTVYGQSWPLECGVYTYPAGVTVPMPPAEYPV